MSDDQANDDQGPGKPAPEADDSVDVPIIDASLDPESEEGEALERRPWREGPDEEADEASWLALDDDELLHTIETLGSQDDHDERLAEVVASDRHFFIRQEAAKRMRDRTRLFAFEDDRHIGQILVRHLTRREDLTYLERLAIRCRHAEVRSAAQVQLARVWGWLEAPHTGALIVGTGRFAAVKRPTRTPTPVALPALPQPQAQQAAPSLPEGVGTTEALAGDGVDASLLGWAAHFIVEHAWGHLGTATTRELLRRTHEELVPRSPSLRLFGVSEEARVTTEVTPGARIAAGAVREVAAWMTAFRAAARSSSPEVQGTSVRGCTALMADALREAGFYAACDAAEAGRRS